MWKVQNFRTLITSTGTVPFSQLEPVADYRDRFVDSLTLVLRTRSGADDLRLSLANTLLDIFVTFSTLVHAKPARVAASQIRRQTGDADPPDAYLSLALEVPRKTQGLLLQILAAAEKAFAKRTKRTLEEDDIEDEPVDPDEDPRSEDEGDDVDMDEGGKEQRMAQTLLAEQKLCALAGRMVLALWAGVLDGKTEGAKNEDGVPLVEMRLKRNYKRLGPNFKAVIDQFESNKPGEQKRKAAAKAKSKNAANAKKREQEKQKKSDAMVLEDDDIEDEEMEGREDERRRDEEQIEAEQEEIQADEAEEDANDAEHGAQEEAESVVGD